MAAQPLRVLLAEDDHVSGKLVELILAREKSRPFVVCWVKSLAQALDRLGRERFDAIVLGLDLPDSKGIETFRKVNGAASETAIVLLAAPDAEAAAADAVHYGAQDYLIKGPIDSHLLVRSVRYAVERKRAQSELARLASFPEKNPNPIVEIDGSERLSYLNPAAREQFPDLEAKGFGHPVLGDVRAFLAALRKDPRRNIVSQVKLGEHTYEQHVHLEPTSDVMRLNIVDVTERARIEHLKEEFLHNVSHELRSPLSAICQSVQLVLEDMGDDSSPAQRRFLEIADRNVEQLRVMIEDLLETTRAETGKLTVEPRRVVLPALIAEAAGDKKLVAQEKGISVSAEVEEDLPRVFADPVRVRQILINLVDNAIKFTPEKGSVILRGGVFDKEPGMVLVSVADTGCGIERDVATRIFDRLYQVERGRKGLGLGLYICEQLATRHGGRIWLESEPGKGSTFLFTLPVFSLEKFLAPVLMREGRPRDGLALVTAELYPANHFLTEGAMRSVQQEARNVLKRDLPADNLILPEMSPQGKEGLVFVATGAGAEGATNVARRMRSLLADAHVIQLNRLEPRVSVSTVDLPDLGDASAEALVKAAARALEDYVLHSIKERAASK
ncbi:MAG: ATP-binding protein [Elusimicrobiota bacterium]